MRPPVRPVPGLRPPHADCASLSPSMMGKRFWLCSAWGADSPQSCLFHQRHRLHLYPQFEPRLDTKGCSGLLRHGCCRIRGELGVLLADFALWALAVNYGNTRSTDCFYRVGRKAVKARAGTGRAHQPISFTTASATACQVSPRLENTAVNRNVPCSSFPSKSHLACHFPVTIPVSPQLRTT